MDPLSQLDLTDAQKTQIAQIRHSAESARAKHADILAVLTPTQKAQLKQLHGKY
jgi:Spy/CpxP family protein refolding chaperone